MLVLAIESSCDETAASVVNNGRMVLSNIVASQIDIHSRYGGVVPEIASRKHMETIIPVIIQSLDEAGISLRDIEGIAVTRGPGLVGSLLVGLQVAKSIAFARGIPFIGVNHLEGHVSAVYLNKEVPDFPFIALVVSGGHTDIYLVRNFARFSHLGGTKDDAAGEAFDKAAKLLEIGYPGGVVIDRLARGADRKKIAFPRPLIKDDGFDFSFSGLKTALLSHVKKMHIPPAKEEIPDLVASYQEAIVDVLVDKTLRAAKTHAVNRVVLAGGVAANSRLRERFHEDADRLGIKVFIPPLGLCTDNAAMIAVVGDYYLSHGERDGLELNALSRWPLDFKKNDCVV
jgi:N6-L-threonylcarbamoyladenine synthase